MFATFVKKYIKRQTTKFLLFKLYGNEIYIYTNSNKCQRSENYKIITYIKSIRINN